MLPSSSNSTVGLYPRWISMYLTPWTAPVLHPLNVNSCVSNEVSFNSLRFAFSLSFWHWSWWSISLSDGHSSSHISHGKAMTMLPLSWANFFRFRRRLRSSDRLTSCLFWRKLFARNPFLFLRDHLRHLIILQRKSRCCYWWKCFINIF